VTAERTFGQAAAPAAAGSHRQADRALVLHVINSLQISGGAEQQLVANLRRFGDPRLRHAVAHLYSYEREVIRNEVGEGGSSPRDAVGTRGGDLPEGLAVHTLRAAGERAGQWESIRRLHRLVAEIRPDLIHCYLAEAAVASRIVGRIAGIPVVESLVNISHERIRCVDNPAVSPWKLRAHTMLDRLTMRGVGHFHALSEAVAGSWHRTVGLSRDRMSVIPRGIDLEELDRTAAEGGGRAGLFAELQLPPDAFLIVNVGRHEAQKGQRYAVEAMPAILAEAPEAVLLIVGRPGNRTDDLRARVRELGLERQVRFTGSRRDVAAIVGVADIFLFPSLFEGLGVSLLEAMGLGKLCIASNIAPMNETVTHGRTGLLFRSMSSPAIAEAVLTAYGDGDLRRRIGEAARKEVARSYRLEETARRVEAIYLHQLGLPDP